MKASFILIAITASTLTFAADIPVDLGTITIPDAAVADVQAWLSTQVKTTTTITYQEVVDPDDGHVYTNVIRTVTVVPEPDPKLKLARLMRTAAMRDLRNAILNLRKEREYAEADATINSAPDPIAEPSE